MDVVRWMVSLKRFSDGYNGEPGLGLTLELKCRVCGETTIAGYASTIYPEEVAQGQRISESHLGDRKNWFDFAIKHRLAKERSCAECGVVSVVPVRAQTELGKQTQGAVSAEWLRESVQYLALRVFQKRFRDGGSTYEAYKADYNEQRVVEQEWHDFLLLPAS